MTTNLFKRIRTACQSVAGKATHLHINFERIPSYAASLLLQPASRPQLDPNHHYLGHGDVTVAFILMLDSINFGSGYFPYMRKRPGMSGYFTVASAFNEHYKANGPLTAEQLTELTAAECAHIFGQDQDNCAMQELMHLFATALNHLGRYVIDCFNGSFIDLVTSAGRSAERLVELLTGMPYFNDLESYDGLQVPFYKRAQLTVADLALAFGAENPGRFDDLQNLTIFADNLVPHVLRVDGALIYENQLAARIDREELIPSGSPEEIEIRACALHVVELIVAHLRNTGHHVTAMALDYLLWNRGQQSYYKTVYPRHRTRTVFY